MSKQNKRPLNEDEKALSEKVLKSIETERDHLNLLVEYNTFMLDKMLFSNYLEKRRGYKKQNDAYEAEIVELNRTIDITTKQIEDGVEIKNIDVVDEKAPTMVN